MKCWLCEFFIENSYLNLYKIKTLKIILICIFFGMIGLLFQSLWYDSQERKFYNIQIPKGEYYQKPIEFLSYNQIDGWDR
ncbi:hypothetical protein [Bernardetia litoralis]|nr:hypothetical protein [Bernardetia litoralis]